jgi:hypothetical protein
MYADDGFWRQYDRAKHVMDGPRDEEVKIPRLHRLRIF